MRHTILFHPVFPTVMMCLATGWKQQGQVTMDDTCETMNQNKTFLLLWSWLSEAFVVVMETWPILSSCLSPPQNWERVKESVDRLLNTYYLLAAVTTARSKSSLSPSSDFLSHQQPSTPEKSNWLKLFSLSSAEGIFQSWIVNMFKARLWPCLFMPWFCGMREERPK
jgi:hypothetical protein